MVAVNCSPLAWGISSVLEDRDGFHLRALPRCDGKCNGPESIWEMSWGLTP
jgi:hypothetical protein